MTSLLHPGADWHVSPCGDRCLVVSFEPAALMFANRLAGEAARRLGQAALAGVTDIVPCMAAVGIHYDPVDVARAAGSDQPWQALCAQVSALLRDLRPADDAQVREVVIPVCYGGEFGEDLDEAAQTLGLSADELVQLHSGETVSVLTIGFAPGHPYIGLFDPRLAIGRRATPRTAVPQGSIGLANRQSVIYPTTLPGGWSIIGRTPLRLFDPASEMPCLLNPGDRVRFEPITPAAFTALAAAEDPA